MWTQPRLPRVVTSIPSAPVRWEWGSRADSPPPASHVADFTTPPRLGAERIAADMAILGAGRQRHTTRLGTRTLVLSGSCGQDAVKHAGLGILELCK